MSKQYVKKANHYLFDPDTLNKMLASLQTTDGTDADPSSLKKTMNYYVAGELTAVKVPPSRPVASNTAKA